MGVTELIIYLLAQGTVISFAVDALKRIPFVAANPKITAAALNLAATVAAAFFIGALGGGVTNFLLAVAAAFSAFTTSVGVHEVKNHV